MSPPGRPTGQYRRAEADGIPMRRTTCYTNKWLPEERETMTRRAEAGLAAIKSLLENKGLAYHPAIVSMPRDLRIMHGEADLLIYDNEKDVFRVVS